MAKLEGDLVPLTSGTSHLGINSNGNGAFDISSLNPFGNIHQLSGIFHNENGSSGVIRFGLNNFEFSSNGGITFVTPAFVTGNNADVFFNDNGSIGTDSEGIKYYKNFDILAVSGSIALKNESISCVEQQPSMGSGITQIVTINLAERSILGITNSGQNIPYFMQPALFNKQVFMAYPNTTTTISSYGNSLTNTGTVSHAAATSASGYMINIATAATANSNAGCGANATLFCRGAESGVNTGFFMTCRFTLPDQNYDGARIFVGLSNGAITAQVAATDTPNGDYCGFQFSTTQTNPKNWRFRTRDGTTLYEQDTNISCSGNRIFDAYMYCPPFPNNDVIYWTLRDVSWNRITNGYANVNLPRKGQVMRPMIVFNNVTASARNMRFTHLYCESQDF